ncbi:MAG: methyltransferase domain-containing protein [Planctomycetota bacterium]
MRRRHFEALQPVCPICRGAEREPRRLQLAAAVVADDECVEEGLLHCENPLCRREYPILDGIPVLIADLRDYVSGSLLQLLQRQDLSPLLESLIGDCAGPGSTFDVTRQHLSIYGLSHYAEKASALVRILDRGLELMGTSSPSGLTIDLGCSVGRTSFELADRTADLVLGIDMNFAMLQVAQSAMRTGVARFPQRRVGVVYEQAEHPVHCANPDKVDFWACSAAALPFDNGAFDLAVALNLIDCVSSPLDLLQSTANVLREGGKALFATPYDWSPGATPLEAWVGGHSQRTEHAGRSEPLLRALLTPGAHPASLTSLALQAEDDDLPWSLRLHDRATANYGVHLLVAERAVS